MKNNLKIINKEEMLQVYYSRIQELKKLLDKHNIRFFAAFGTLLGAFRNKGMIPWDDDADFWMPRADYETFIKLHKMFENEHFKVCHYKIKGTTSRNGHLTVALKGFYFKNKYEGKKEFLIDIFPIDFIPEDREVRLKCAKQLKFPIFMTYFKRRDNSSTLLRTIGLRLLQFALLPISINWLDRQIEKKYLLSLSNNKVSGAGVNLIFLNPFIYIRKHGDYIAPFTADSFFPTSLCDFGPIQIPIPAHTDELLRFMYGDNYMTPIPRGRNLYNSIFYISDSDTNGSNS